MKKFDLQLFAEAVQGKKIVYLYRLLKDAATDDAQNIAFVTGNGRSVSVDSDSTSTKDGTIRTPGTPKIEITTESILAKGDTLIAELEEAQLKGHTLEIWEANLEEPAESGENKFKGTYYQGLITGFELTSASDDFATVSMTFGINGTGAKGNVTVTTEQQEMANYVFKDTQKTGAQDASGTE